MIIKYQDIDLKTHEIDLGHVVNVRVNGFQIIEDGFQLTVKHDDAISINPIASNCVNVSKRE